jgi:hypothetical protein
VLDVNIDVMGQGNVFYVKPGVGDKEQRHQASARRSMNWKEVQGTSRTKTKTIEIHDKKACG